ncbi:MAG: hypothetical protein KDN22_01720 [Verrucomicrobiae bacterium]|nr:hypothetical protein [Verrucomicrobiae bacterium]
MNTESIDDRERERFWLKKGLSSGALALLIGMFPMPVGAGTFLGNHGFLEWGIGYDDSLRIGAEIAPGLQPSVHDFCPIGAPAGLEFNYEGKTFGVAQRFSPDLDFDLPVDAFDRSITVRFGPALFNMALPFLSFNEAAATYSFQDTWAPAPGAALLSDKEILLTEDDPALTGVPFDPASLIPESLYDLDGAPVNGNQWGTQSVSQMLSAVVMGYDLGEVEDVRRSGMTAALGSISSVDFQKESGDGDLGLVGIVAMLALGGAALFITLEINRDKFDKYR